MIRIATIGTSNITSHLAGALMLCPEQFEYKAAYSRSRERGLAFAAPFGCTDIVTDLEELANRDDLDAVYIASPNSLHYEQAMTLVQHKKHLLIEKPAVIHEEDYFRLRQAAEENGVVLMEALIGMHLPARKILKEAIENIGRIHTARFEFCQLSSKYRDYLLGENPNIFNPRFQAGSLMDLGIYCVYPALHLFGIPAGISTRACLLDSGIDASVTSIFDYSDRLVTLMASKTAQSELPSEILGDRGSIQIGHISRMDHITLTDQNGHCEELVGEMSKEEQMKHELLDFFRYITQPEQSREEYQSMLNLSLHVCSVMETMRMQAGLPF